MKNSNKGLLGVIAFIGLIIIAVLEILSFFTSHNIIKVSGGVLIDVLNTIKNVCVIFVIGACSYYFVCDKPKGLKITYYIALALIIITTIFIWIKF